MFVLVCLTIWLLHFIKNDSYGKELKIVLATNINPKIVGGKRQSFSL